MKRFCVGLDGFSLGLPRFSSEEDTEEDLSRASANQLNAVRTRNAYMPKESSASTVRGVIGPVGRPFADPDVDIERRPGETRGEEDRPLEDEASSSSASSENRDAKGGRGVMMLEKFVTLGGGVGKQPIKGAPRPCSDGMSNLRTEDRSLRK